MVYSWSFETRVRSITIRSFELHLNHRFPKMNAASTSGGAQAETGLSHADLTKMRKAIRSHATHSSNKLNDIMNDACLHRSTKILQMKACLEDFLRFMPQLEDIDN